MHTSFKTFYKVTFITAIALAIVCGTFVSRGVQAQTTVGASVVGTNVDIEQSATVSATSSAKYQIVRPSAGETLTIGDSVAVSWTRPARSPYSATLTLRLTPVPQKGEKLTPEFVFAVGVSGTAYKWVVPTRIIPGTYKITVVPSVGTWALSTSSTVTIKAKEVVKKPGNAKYNQYDPAALAGETDQSGNTTSLETKFYMKITANGGVVKMPKQSDFEIEFGNGKSVTNCYLKLDRNLAVGSTGADVVALHSFLESKGLLTMAPGVAKGYFGASTKAAVAKYQVSKGITPADGYVSPITRASMMADCGSNTIVSPATEIRPIVTSAVTLSADSYADMQSGESRNFTVKGRVNVAGAPTGLYTATLRVKTASGTQEFPAQTYVNVITQTNQTKDPELTIFQLAQPILPNTYIISPADGVQNANLNGFAVKSEGATSTISTVSVKVNGVGTSTLPGTVYLWDRMGTLYASKTVPANGMVTFDNNSIHILKDRTMDFVVKGDFPSSAISGSTVNVDIVGITTTYGKVIKTSLPLVGNKITVVSVTGNYGGIATYDQVGQPTISTSSDQNGYTVSATASFSLTATAMGGDVTQPKPSDYKVVFEKNGTPAVVATSVSVVTIPNNNIAEGSIASVTITASAPMQQMQSGLYRARIVNIKTLNGFTDIVTPSSVNILPKPKSVSASMLSASVGIALRMVFGSIVSLFGY